MLAKEIGWLQVHGLGTSVGWRADDLAPSILKLLLRAAIARVKGEYDVVVKQEDERVREAGGLHVIGTERHESRRVDNQLRGRAGRQGDPGSTCFFL